MTQLIIQEQIQTQIEIIKKANQEARRTKASATQFLIDAGILKEKQTAKSINKKK